MRYIKPREFLIGFFILLFGILISLLANYSSTAQVVFFIGFLISVMCVILIVVRVKNYGISDALVTFLLFFLFYNGIILINFSSFVGNGFFSTELFPTSFRAETVVIAGLLSLSALFGTIIGGFLYRILFSQRRERNFSNRTKKFSDRFLLFWAFIFYVVGILMLLISYTGVGGFFGSLSIDRLQRLNILMSAHTLPYPGFIFVGLAISFYVYFTNKRFSVLLFSLVFLAIWALLLLLQGDRRLLMYSLLIVVAMWGIAEGDAKIKKFSIQRIFVFLLIVFIGYLAFSFFSGVRFLIPLLISKKWTLSDSLIWIKDHISMDWFMPGKTEFGAPYLSLLYYIENKGDRLLGSSYAFSIPYLLPRSLYPGVKPTFLADNFAIRIHDEFFSFKDVIKGWGYSPVAEAFQNFGALGPLLVFTVLGFIFESFSKLRYSGFWGQLVFLVALPELLNFNRMCFTPVFQEFVYFLVPVILLFLIYDVLFFKRKSD
jgi:hypothetical protein